MELKNKIHEEIKVAMKSGDSPRRDILRVAQNEMDMIGFRENRGLTEDEQQKIIRKMVQNNKETLDIIEQNEDLPSRVKAACKLVTENEILESFLPQLWGKEEIIKHIYDRGIDGLVFKAASVGQAMGVAMKSLKSAAAPVDGKTVKEAVEEIRKGT